MTGPIKGKTEVISPKKYPQIKQAFEDCALWVWKHSKIIVPKMNLDFRVYFQEIYASTVGRIWIFTPFWRGTEFTQSILMHEFLHWAIYPVDLWKGLENIFMARRFLAKDLGYKPQITENDLYGEVEDWKDFEYSIKEFSFVSNILGDYLINLHIHDYFPYLWKELWSFLYHDGTFYEQQKALKRDTTFMLYLSVYPEFLNGLDQVNLLDPKSEIDRDKIADIIKEVRKGRMSNVYALKELVKIFHNYLMQDAKDAQKQGKGAGQGGEPKCPQCGHDEFEITGYEDPKTGKWVDV